MKDCVEVLHKTENPSITMLPCELINEKLFSVGVALGYISILCITFKSIKV